MSRMSAEPQEEQIMTGTAFRRAEGLRCCCRRPARPQPDPQTALLGCEEPVDNAVHSCDGTGVVCCGEDMPRKGKTSGERITDETREGKIRRDWILDFTHFAERQ